MKKVLSIVLSLCMLLTMFSGLTVSAAADTDVIAEVTTSDAGNGSFTIAFYCTDTTAEAFGVTINFDATKYTLTTTKKNQIYNTALEGTTVQNTNTAGKVALAWYTTEGGMLDKDSYEELAPAANGKYEIAHLTFELNKAALTNEDYDNKLKIDFEGYSFAAPTDTIPSVTFVEFNIPDARGPIEGLTATAKTDLVYTGEVIDAASAITVNTEADDVVEYKVEYKSEPAEIKNAGTYKVTATVKRAGCKATDVSADVVVAPKAITAKVDNATKVYGEKDPDFTAKAEGLVGEDTLEYAFTREAGEDAGKYAINATATNANYTVDVTAGELEITPKAITAKVDDATKVYGEKDPDFTAKAEGLKEGDKLEYVFTREEGENVGTYKIDATATNPNYTVKVTAGNFEITKKDVTIKVQDEFQVLGGGKLTSFKTPEFEGLVGNDTIEITEYVVEGWVDGTEDTFDISVKFVANDNYEVKVEPGKYEIKAAIPVNVTFGENKKTYGDADDAEINVEADLDLVTITRVAGLEKAAAGEYENAFEVTLKAAEDANGVPYALVVTNNKFVVEPKAATITVANAEKKVGAADPAFTFTAEGFLEGEAPAEVAFSRTEGEAAGEYDITATYADPNYAITVVDGKLAISKYALTVTAPTVKVNLNKEVPELEAAVEGAVDGDVIVATVTVYNGEEIVAEVDTSVEAEYTTKATSDANTDKYDVTYVDGTLTVKKASSRPSGGGSVVRPATKPEDKEDVKDDETDKPAASANIALKENAKEIKFIEGYEDKTFRPDANATRNDVVSALTALFDVTDIKNAPSFNDTDDAAIKALAAAGVINGYEDGSFKGYNDVTRAEFVKLVAAALKLEKVEGATADFSDIEGHWAAEWIKTFVGKGYLVGYPDGTFRPEDKITRAEMVVVITRVVGTVDAEAAVNFADVDDAHWAYDYIMKAAK